MTCYSRERTEMALMKESRLLYKWD